MTQCCCWAAASGRPGGTRDRHDRGLLALSQGPDRAGVGDVPGPAGVRAAAGTGDRPGQRERHPAGLPAPLQPALRRARRERDPRPRGRYRRGSISPGCVRSAGVGPSPRTVASGSTGWSSSCRLARAAARSPAGGSNSSSGSTAAVPAPPEPARLREVRVLASGGPSPEPNSRNVGNRPGDDHPWRRISPGFKLARARRVDRPLTDSLSS